MELTKKVIEINEEVKNERFANSAIADLNRLIVLISIKKYDGYIDDIIFLDNLKNKCKATLSVDPEELLSAVYRVLKNIGTLDINGFIVDFNNDEKLLEASKNSNIIPFPKK